jgi:signal transduction histidine kinase
MSKNVSSEVDQKTQKSLSRLRRLVELSVTLNSTLNVKDLLARIIRTAAEVLDCEAASLLLYDEKKDVLFFAAATGEDAGKLAKIPVPLKNSLAGTIFSRNQPLVINELEDDSRHNRKASAYVGLETRSLLGVPLQIQERTIGVLEALNKKGGEFSESDIITLSVIASHAAVAINNAQLVQALEKAYEEVKKADELKSNFLSLASHELRTPLGIIIGYATFLGEEEDSETSAHAEHVLTAALKMRTLLEDMNNLTMLESETSSFSRQKMVIQEALKNATNEIEELAQVKEQEIIFEFPQKEIEVKLDDKKFSAAIVNLLHNAVRFSPEKAKIVLGVIEENGAALCWIKDEGIGIPKDELEKIFDKFYQVEDHNVRHYGGMGIGLTIAEGLIEAQGGRIWAESDGVGKGATFKILLPM